MKKTLTIAAMAFSITGLAHAASIFDATTSNTTMVDNGVDPGSANTITGTPGALVFTQTGGKNNNAGFTSTDSINTLLGAASLTAADTLTFTATVSSISGNLRANGFEFGMIPNATSFRGDTPGGDGNLILALTGDGAEAKIAGNAFTGAGLIGFGVNEASMLDGFGITLTADNAGWTFSFTGLTASTGTIADVTGTFTGTQFVDNFSGSHFYVSTQTEGDNNLVVNFSEASIAVVPEPGTYALLAGFTGLVYVMLRRRR